MRTLERKVRPGRLPHQRTAQSRFLEAFEFRYRVLNIVSSEEADT